MIAKVHERMGQSILAVCDKEILGKTLENEKMEFKVSEKFYGGEGITEEELLEKLKEHNSANLVGNKCVGILQEKGLINESSIIMINDIKHVQVYNLE